MNTIAFDPTRYLRKLNGKDYLEVVHRLQWIRAEHLDASITTTLLHVDFPEGWAIFHARVEIPGAGIAEGTGSETRAAFPAGWLEKAETVAIGRALAALGYGTAWALDFETADAGNGHLADAPLNTPCLSGYPMSVQTPRAVGTGNGHLADAPIEPATTAPSRPEPTPIRSSSAGLASPAQLKLLYMVGSRDAHLSEEEIDEQSQRRYGRLPMHLSKREASELIDALKVNAATKARPNGSA